MSGVRCFLLCFLTLVVVDACASPIDKDVAGPVRPAFPDVSHSNRAIGGFASKSHSHYAQANIQLQLSSALTTPRHLAQQRPQTRQMAANTAGSMMRGARAAGARSAWATPPRLSSHWATAMWQRRMHSQNMASPVLRQSTIVAATSPSWLRNRRQFSASPAPRHGHLDPPRPGEECVITALATRDSR